MISGTITDMSGRTLSGQTPAAFWYSLRHVEPFTIGLNCALGAREMRSHISELARTADTFVCAYPNAGLPNEFGEYDESPEAMAEMLGEFASAGLVNVVGGCCGTTPDHIRAIADAVAPHAPRKLPEIPRLMRLSGLEPFVLTPEVNFVNVGERTNVTGSARFRKLVREGDYAAALAVARDQVENGAQVIDINMDEGLLDSEQAMVTFLNLVAAEPDIARVPIMIDSSKWSVIEAGLKCIQGKGIVNSISLKEGEEAFIHHARLVRATARRWWSWPSTRTARPTRSERKIAICKRSYDVLTEKIGLPAGRHHLRPEHLRGRHRHRGAQQLRRRLHRGDEVDQTREPSPRPHLGRPVEPVVLVPRQRARARGDALHLPLPCDCRRHGHGHRQRGPARHL